MTPSSIRRVLSTFRRRRLKALLMGGQACILYGGAEFSRDVDFAVAVSPDNLRRLRSALQDLDAVPIFFPPLSAAALRRGHACHFRCRRKEVAGLRIDVMTRMRDAAPFAILWRRRNEVRIAGLGSVPVIALEDLVRIKKTQRDKDWLMLRRLVEADIMGRRWEADARRARYWLTEARTPALLVELARRYPALARQVSTRRPAARAALGRSEEAVARALLAEERAERVKDRRYWAPLRRELERCAPAVRPAACRRRRRSSSRPRSPSTRGGAASRTSRNAP